MRPAQPRAARAGLDCPPTPEVGVHAAWGRVGGRPIVCYAQDSSIAAGSVGVPEAEVIVRALRHSRQARVPLVGFMESVGRAAAGGGRGAGRLRADLLRERGALRALAPDLGDHGCLGRRRLLFAGADRLRRDDRQGLDVPDRSADRQAGARRGRHDRRDSAAPACTPATASATSSPATIAARCGCCASCSGYLPQNGSEPRRRRSRRRPPPARTRPACCRPTQPQLLRRSRADRAARRRRSLPRGLRALGAQHGRRLRPPGGTDRRDHRQPGAPPRRRHRRRTPRRRAGSSYAPATPSGSRCSSLVDTPGFMPGSREEAAGMISHGAELVRAFAGGHAPARDGDRAQGIRRRVHHDELKGPRRRRLVLLAERGDRHHEPGGRRRDHPRSPAATASAAPSVRERLARRYAEDSLIGPGRGRLRRGRRRDRAGPDTRACRACAAPGAARGRWPTPIS